jgi:hypothetical protein
MELLQRMPMDEAATRLFGFASMAVPETNLQSAGLT